MSLGLKRHGKTWRWLYKYKPSSALYLTAWRCIYVDSGTTWKIDMSCTSARHFFPSNGVRARDQTNVCLCVLSFFHVLRCFVVAAVAFFPTIWCEPLCQPGILSTFYPVLNPCTTRAQPFESTTNNRFYCAGRRLSDVSTIWMRTRIAITNTSNGFKDRSNISADYFYLYPLVKLNFFWVDRLFGGRTRWNPLNFS